MATMKQLWWTHDREIELKDIEIPTPISLAIIFGVLVLSMGLSVIISRRKA